jgi:hypothetical protein
MTRFRPTVGRLCVVATASLLVSGCLPADDTDRVVRVLPPQVAVERVEPSPAIEGIPGLEIVDGLLDPVPEPLVDLAAIRPSGLPPDALPSLDEPPFIRTRHVWFLQDREPVIALEIDGDARAYPLQILMWHEIANDVVGGVPVAVTYCPLCNSAAVYERHVGERVLEFGVSGRLINSSLVMHDRQTGSLWSHYTGGAVVGDLTGTELVTHPVSIVAWADWRAAHPNGLVLDRETGFIKEYGLNPYPGYDDADERPFLFEGEVDGRYTAMTRIAAFTVGDDPIAVTLDRLRTDRSVRVTAGGRDLIVVWTPGVSSALDSFDVAAGVDVGATMVAVVDPDDAFSVVDGRLIDDATGSEWDVFGRATAGERRGERLERVAHVDTFWFAWAAFRPDTTVVG